MNSKTLKTLIFSLLFFCSCIIVQGQTVTGNVKDADGPIPGLSILVKGTTNGTVTNIEGNYKLDNVSDDATLVFSFIGFKTQEVNVNGRSIVDVTMVTDLQQIDEVVIVGYGTQKRSEVTTSIATVKEEDFNKGGVRSPMDLVQGKVAGLNLTRTSGNNPNAGTSIQLRGVSSLTGTVEPLIVIDGIPGGNLDLLQQDDIESIDVLKDGSAAAIYGTRANAGVILVTTKKGAKNQTSTTYSTYYSQERIDKKPNYLNAEEFRYLIDKGIINGSEDYGTSTDLYDELINKNNLTQYHHLSVSSGNEKTSYRASVYYNELQGIAKRNEKEQFGGRLNVNHLALNDLLSIQMNVASNFNKADLLGGQGSDFEQAIQRNPTAPLFNEDGTFLETQAYNNYNPLSRLANRISERNQQTFSGDIKLSLKVAKGLSASVFGSYVRNGYNDRVYRSKNDWAQRESTQYKGMGYASKKNVLTWGKTIESTVNYNTTIAEDHTIRAIAGYSYQYNVLERFSVNNNGFTTDAFNDWNLGAGSAINDDTLPRPGMGSFKEDNTLIGFFGRINYAYLNKYFAQVILRREGSSRFGDNNKWGNFPAASIGWTVSEESFMKDIRQIDNLKLRFGYGVTGNQGIPNYQSLVTLSTGGVYPQDGVYLQTYGPSRNPNNNLKWEEKEEINLGIDFSLFKHRISGAIDIYQRKTNDLLYKYSAQQPPFVQNQIYTNVGTLSNKGIEIQLSGLAMKKKDFQWNIDLTASNQKNKLDRLSNDVFQANYLEFGGLPSPGNLGNAIRLEEGGSVGNFYGKRFAGLDENGKWLFYKADGSKAPATEINDEDLVTIGNGVPKVQASLNNTFKYKNFDLTIFLRGKFGFDILNTKEIYFGNLKWLPNNVLGTAITEHFELNDDPQYSDYYLEKGDFVKLDNITFGYNLKLNSNYVKSARVYVTARNLATFTGYSGIDPELQDTGFTTGIDSRGFYPRTKTFTIGVNINL